MFNAGKSYPAKLIDAGVTVNSKGAPTAFLKVEVAEGDEKRAFTWMGSFNEGKAQEITVKALITAGFIGADAEDLQMGLVMFKEQPFFASLDTDDKGNLRVQWINSTQGAVVKKFEGAAPKLASAFTKFRAELNK